MKNMTLLTCSLVMCALPAVFAEQAIAKQTVYQFKSVQTNAAKPNSTLTKSSNEYWQTYTGKELKQGVELALSDKEQLIRVAPKARYEQGQVFKPKGLELKQLKLLDKQTKKELKLQRKADQQQMRDAGFDDGSVALASLDVSNNPILKTDQALNDNDKYLVHVKEKKSKFVLKAKNQLRKSHKSDSLKFELDLNGKKPNKKQVKLVLHSPSNESVNVALVNDKVVFDQPLETIGAINGFYEIEALVTMDVSGEPLKRSIKMPFSNEIETASIGTETYRVKNRNVHVEVPVSVEMPGRYALKATLAMVKNGKVNRLATVEVAKQIEHADTLMLPFNVMSRSKGQFTLVDVELTDQTRMIKMYPELTQ